MMIINDVGSGEDVYDVIVIMVVIAMMRFYVVE